VHQNFHFLRQGYQRIALGWNRNALHAKSKEDYEINNSGDVKFHLALPVSLESDAFALQAIREYERGKLILWAWSSRGYSTVNEIAEWLFNGNIKEASELLSPMPPGSLTKYIQGKELPALHILGEDKKIQIPDGQFLSGERVHLWFVDTGKDGMIALPHWFSMPIECCIALWRTEQQNWEEKKMARHPKPLTPSQQKLYDAWVDNSTRRLVLDQAQRCQITHPSSVSRGYLVKHGILLEAGPSMEQHFLFLRETS